MITLMMMMRVINLKIKRSNKNIPMKEIREAKD